MPTFTVDRLASALSGPTPRLHALVAEDETGAVGFVTYTIDFAIWSGGEVLRIDIVGRPLEFYLGYRGRKRDERVKEILFQIGLDPSAFINRFPAELSGGQKQRIGIARALAAEPRLLICDEVTSALDQIVAKNILKLLDDIQHATGLAYLFITHDLTCVRAISDDVIVMEKGRVVEAQPKDLLFSQPHHPYTRCLLQAVPEASPQWLTGILAGRGQDRRSGGRFSLDLDRRLPEEVAEIPCSRSRE